MKQGIRGVFEEGEVVEHEFRIGKCKLYLTDRRLIIVKRRVHSYRYRDVSLVHIVDVSRFTALLALVIAYILREVYYALKPMPFFLELAFLAAILTCCSITVYKIFTGGSYMEIYISGRKKPLRIKANREKLEKAVKIIRKTIRKRR